MADGSDIDVAAARVTRAQIERAMRAPAGRVRAAGEREDAAPRLRRASVLCPVVERPGGLSVILTRRSDHLKAHPGQIAFPGGKVDPTDPSPLAAALREAEEEIGLVRRHVDVAGALEPYATGTGFLVTPFVGFVDPRFRPVPEAGEVAEVFELPMDHMMDPANHRRESVTRSGRTRSFWVIPCGPRRVWGATAGMLRVLAERLAVARGETLETPR